MAWTSLSVFSVGQVLTSALMNAIRGNLLELDPSNGEPGSVPRVNATQDGYNFGGGDDVAVAPADWGTSYGVKYRALLATSAPSGGGWTVAVGSLTGASGVADGSTSDFLSAADFDGAGSLFGLNQADHKIVSPKVFGDWVHARAVQQDLGALPTKLIVRFMFRFPIVANDEQASYIGLSSADGTGDTVGGITIHSGGTNFRLRMGSTGTEDAGAAVDTDWHLGEIHVEADLVTWYIDEVAQGQIAEDEDDLWPMCFNARTQNNIGNEIIVAWVEIEYQ